ncbi:MAG: glycyl-radical enzyme activating protein [Erysipelotrichaceae bacterium]
MMGRIAKIQTYSTKDGPGIRTTVFMKGCNLKCKWCANPEMLTSGQSVMFFKERCQNCGECVRLARPKQTYLDEDGCHINRSTCENLDEVVEGCPYNAFEMIGFEISVDDLVKKLLRDQAFFESSGGGITFSGGEATLQLDFIYECAKQLKKHNIHLCLDTAGNIEWSKLEKVLPYIDLVLYDIKTYDNKLHLEGCGVGNKLILENALKLAAYGKDMIIRMIMIHNFNDQDEDINNRLAFVKSLGKVVKQIDLLPYHNLGEGKYYHLAMKYKLDETSKMDDNRMIEIKKRAETIGCPITIGA